MSDGELHEEENPTNSATGELDDTQDFITATLCFWFGVGARADGRPLGLSNSWVLMCWVCYVN